MSEHQSFLSRLTTKQLYVLVAIGVLISSIFVVLYFKPGQGDLTEEEEFARARIRVFYSAGFTIGFIISLIPSVRIFQNALPKKTPPK